MKKNSLERIINTFETQNNGWVTIEVLDMEDKTHYIEVKSEDLDRYKTSIDPINNIFPYLTEEERDIIRIGVTNEMWANMFLYR